MVNELGVKLLDNEQYKDVFEAQISDLKRLYISQLEDMFELSTFCIDLEKIKKLFNEMLIKPMLNDELTDFYYLNRELTPEEKVRRQEILTEIGFYDYDKKYQGKSNAILEDEYAKFSYTVKIVKSFIEDKIKPLYKISSKTYDEFFEEISDKLAERILIRIKAEVESIEMRLKEMQETEMSQDSEIEI